jgi:transketolase
VTVEDHWPEGGIGEAVLAAFADAAERPRVSIVAVRDLPSSGKPMELLAAAGIDAEHIVEAVRGLVSSSSARAPGGYLWSHDQLTRWKEATGLNRATRCPPTDRLG